MQGSCTVGFGELTVSADWVQGKPTGEVSICLNKKEVTRGRCDDRGRLVEGSGVRFGEGGCLLHFDSGHWEKGRFVGGQLQGEGERFSNNTVYRGIFCRGSFQRGERICYFTNSLEAIGEFDPDGSLKEGFQRNGDCFERKGGGEVPRAVESLFTTEVEVWRNDRWLPVVPARSIALDSGAEAELSLPASQLEAAQECQEGGLGVGKDGEGVGLTRAREHITSLSTAVKAAAAVGLAVLAALLHPPTRNACILGSWSLWNATSLPTQAGVGALFLIALFKKCLWGIAPDLISGRPTRQLGEGSWEVNFDKMPVLWVRGKGEEKKLMQGSCTVDFGKLTVSADWVQGIPTGEVSIRLLDGTEVTRGRCDGMGTLVEGFGVRSKRGRLLADNPDFQEKGIFLGGLLEGNGERFERTDDRRLILYRGVFRKGIFQRGEKIATVHKVEAKEGRAS